MVASKFSFFLLAIIAVPVMIELPFILKLWLKTVPMDTVIFCRLIIILSLVIQLSVGIMVAIQSVGRIKNYQAVVGSVVLLTIPLGYVIFTYGFPSYSIIIVAIVVELIATVVRLFYGRSLVGLSIRVYLSDVVLRGIGPILISVSIASLIQFADINEWFSLILVGFISTVSLCILIYTIGITSLERELLNSMLDSLKRKFYNKS